MRILSVISGLIVMGLTGLGCQDTPVSKPQDISRPDRSPIAIEGPKRTGDTEASSTSGLGRFAVMGVLQTSSLWGPEQELRHYQVTDRSGKTVCYVAPAGQALDVDLTEFLGRSVGLVGTIEPYPRLRTALVRFSEIELLMDTGKIATAETDWQGAVVRDAGDADGRTVGASRDEGPRRQIEKRTFEEMWWEFATTQEHYETYLQNFPHGRHAKEAKERLKSLKAQAAREEPMMNDFSAALKECRTEDEVLGLMQKYWQYSFVDLGITYLEQILLGQVIEQRGTGRLILPIPRVGAARKSRLTIEGVNLQKNEGGPSKQVDGFLEAHSVFGPCRAFKEFPGDEMSIPWDPLTGRMASPISFAHGSVHRFAGKVKFGKEGTMTSHHKDKYQRLTFCVVNGLGYVYLRGRGAVTVGGEIYEFGQRQDE